MALADVPSYPGASELKPGENPIAETLKKNMENDASMRQAVGVGGKTEQKGFKLPADAGWDKVKAFYDDKLKAGGWSEGMGGPGGDIASKVMNQVNTMQSVMQSAIYTKGTQTLSIHRMADPMNASNVVVIASLSSR